MTKAERETLKAEYITGDYRTLKEFAEKKGLNYLQLRKIAAADNWTANKVEHSAQIANNIRTIDQEKRIEQGLRNLENRQDENLDIIKRIKSEVIKNIKGASAKDLNALSSALYRLAEIETNILTVDKSTSEQQKALEELTQAITSAAYDDIGVDDND